jgi:hypothetical protein
MMLFTTASCAVPHTSVLRPSLPCVCADPHAVLRAQRDASPQLKLPVGVVLWRQLEGVLLVKPVEKTAFCTCRWG